MFRDSLVGTRAPDFPRGLLWLNSLELTPRDLRGKIVLIDFWTYSCINCLRTLPYLKSWHEMYAAQGLVIVGVHSPEFEFEKNPEHVKRAVEGLAIKYPVVLDSDYLVWNLYSNHWWPRKLLIDRSGKIIYDHTGEGAYLETENEIRKALGEITSTLPPPAVGVQIPKVCYPQTPELYLGYERGYIGNPRGFGRDREVNYQDDKSPYQKNVLYLHGPWKVTREFVEHARDSKEDYIILNFEGVEANIVAEKIGEEGVIEVTLDDKPIEKGEDLYLENRHTFFKVGYPRMFNLIRRKDPATALLKLMPQDNGIRFYAFTFGGCLD